MEQYSGKTNSIFLHPLKTGTVGDNLTASFNYTKNMILENWKMILFAGVFLIGIDLAVNILIQKSEFISSIITSQTQMVNQVYGDVMGPLIAKMNERSFRVLSILPFLIVISMFRFHRFVRSSEACEDMPKRRFITWLLATFGNQMIASFFMMIVLGIMMTVMIIIIALSFAPKLLPLTILGVVLSISGFCIFVIAIFLLYAISTQITAFSLFRKVYPIAAIKYSIYSLFKSSGSRKGGIFGLNLWHFIGLSILVTIALMMFNAFFDIAIMIVNIFIPKTIPAAQYVANAIFTMISLFVSLIYYFFMLVYPMIYVSENLAFSSHPIKQEIIDRATK
jgi:hypothetical protein